MAAAVGARLNHVSRESPDIKRLAQFYTEVFGFEQVVAPKRPYDVIWLKLGSLYLHIIERDPSSTKPPECGAMSADNLPRSHHVCFSVSNFDYFVQTLKGKGIQVHEKCQSDGKTKQAFFFDPDGNGLEVSSEHPEP
nr:lactoylglutathione lyase [Ipomoea batatas]GME04253.1 lactoylglutathione lyase [Ipomoea batatas]